MRSSVAPNQMLAPISRPSRPSMARHSTSRVGARKELGVAMLLRPPILEHVFESDWMGSLNAAQREAVTCGDGPVLVIAGAGSGKTWTLACRVAYLIEQGVAPERILLLTFSRRAAREMLSRADRLVDQKRTGKVWGGTFHAIANRLLRIYGRTLGLSPDFNVLDQADMADLMDF